MPIYQALLPKISLLFSITTPLLEYGGPNSIGLSSLLDRPFFACHWHKTGAFHEAVSQPFAPRTRRPRARHCVHRRTLNASCSRKETLLASHRWQQLRKTCQLSKKTCTIL